MATPKPQADEEQGVDLAALWRPIRKYWITSVMIAALVTMAAAFYTTRQTKLYEASATVQFDPNPPRPLGGKVESVVEMGSGAVWDTREYYETQYEIIESRKVSLAVVQQRGLNRDPAFLLNLPPHAPVPKNFEPWDEGDAADVLRSRLRVEPVKSSRIATVHLVDADPERAASVLKSLVDSYRELNLQNVIESTEEAATWLQSENDKLTKELDSSEKALHDYKVENNILSVEYDDKSNMLREEIGQLNQTLTTIRTRREEISARYNELAKVPSDNPSQLPASELLSSTLLQGLRSNYISALKDRDALLSGGKGKNHPDVLAADAKVTATRDALLDEVKNIQGSLKGDLAVINRQEGGVSGLFDKAKKEALELNLLEIEYNKLRRQKENTEKLYSLLLERSKESDLTRRLRINNISIVDYPSVPGAPVRPNVPANVAAGMMLGVLLGVAAAFGRNLLDRTVKTPEDVEQVIQATFLGLIPEIDNALDVTPGVPARTRRARRAKAAGAGRELIVHEHPMSGTAEAARSVRTNLLFTTPDKPYRTLLVTSSGPSEGKTTVACCVAVAMAQAGKRVVLVDCDLRRPRIHRIFRERKSDLGPGLTSALLDDTITDCAVTTEVPNLWVVPAGPIPPNPSELLHSERFRAFLGKLSGQFDLVILDSPPLVAVTDATILSTIVDGTLLVVRAFKTTKDLARHANRILADVGARMAGVVLNAVNLNRDEYKYSYLYYRRGNYYASNAKHDDGPGAGASSASSSSPHEDARY